MTIQQAEADTNHSITSRLANLLKASDIRRDSRCGGAKETNDSRITGGVLRFVLRML